MNLEELEKAKHHAERLKAYREQRRAVKEAMEQGLVSGISLTSEKGGRYVTTIREPYLLATSVSGILNAIEDRIQDEVDALARMGVEVDHGD